MSVNISLSEGWSLLKNMLGAKNGTSADDISNADVEKFLKEADLNKDGKVTQDEFEKCCKESSDYKEMEEKYLATFKKLAELDKIAETISGDDIESALAQMDETEEVQDTSGSNGSSGPSGPSGPSSPTSPSEPPSSTEPTAKDPANATPSTIPPVSLTGEESMQDLQTGRDSALSELDKLQADKANIKGSAEYKDAQASYNESNQAYTESLNALDAIYQAKIEAGEQLTAEEQAYVDAKAAREEAVTAVTDQEGVIQGVNDQLSTLDTNISDTESQLSSLQPPSESLKVPIYNEEGEQTGVDTSAYDAAMAEYQAQKTQLEAQKADLESQKAELELQLADEETKLSELQEDVLNKDVEIQTALENLNAAKENSDEVTQEEKDQIKAVQDAQATYVSAWENVVKVEQELTAQVNADIEQARANIKAYDEAIKQKDAEQQANLPEGMHSRNGFIYEGEGENERLMMPVEQSEEGPNLPAGYKVDEETGTVVDEQGTVVGKVVTTSKDHNGDGTEDEVQSIYLFTDSILKTEEEPESEPPVEPVSTYSARGSNPMYSQPTYLYGSPYAAALNNPALSSTWLSNSQMGMNPIVSQSQTPPTGVSSTWLSNSQMGMLPISQPASTYSAAGSNPAYDQNSTQIGGQYAAALNNPALSSTWLANSQIGQAQPVVNSQPSSAEPAEETQQTQSAPKAEAEQNEDKQETNPTQPASTYSAAGSNPAYGQDGYQLVTPYAAALNAPNITQSQTVLNNQVVIEAEEQDPYAQYYNNPAIPNWWLDKELL